MADRRRRAFWELSCNDILSILCAAAVPIALGIYTGITYRQEQDNTRKTQEIKVKQAIEQRQGVIFDMFLDNIYKLEKNGYLALNDSPWAFANAYYRAAHRQLDAERKADVLQFLKEKKLIGRCQCSTPCGLDRQEDIIRLNELSFDNVVFRSDTGTLYPYNLGCVTFDQVSMSFAMFAFANLNCVSFDHGRLDNVKFGRSSLRCAHFNGTDLRGVDFGDADLTGATFWNVDLSTVKLTEEQIRQANFTNTIMPNGRAIPNRRTTAMITTTITKIATTGEIICRLKDNQNFISDRVFVLTYWIVSRYSVQFDMSTASSVFEGCMCYDGKSGRESGLVTTW